MAYLVVAICVWLGSWVAMAYIAGRWEHPRSELPDVDLVLCAGALIAGVCWPVTLGVVAIAAGREVIGRLRSPLR